MNKEEEEKKDEEENEEEEEEDEIRTTMQSYAAMEHGSTRGPRELFLSSKRGEGGGREEVEVEV